MHLYITRIYELPLYFFIRTYYISLNRCIEYAFFLYRNLLDTLGVFFSDNNLLKKYIEEQVEEVTMKRGSYLFKAGDSNEVK